MENVAAATRSKLILVTGASGFVGRPLVAALCRAGYAVRAATRHPIPFPEQVDLTIVPDFRNIVRWKPIVANVDVVIHLAGLAHTNSRDSAQDDYDRINWTTTLDLARAAKDADVERFVFISSVRAQAGPSAAHTLREKDDPHPTDHYGRSKLAAELAVKATGLPFTILRPVAMYGPQPQGNIKRLVQLAKLPFPLPFSGFNNRRSLLGIDNLISAILFVLNNKNTVDESFLVADSASHSFPEIVAMLRKAQGRRPGLIYIPPTVIRIVLNLLGQRRIWQRISEDLVVDTNKLKSFGWRPSIDTYTGFCSMLAAETTRSDKQD